MSMLSAISYICVAIKDNQLMDSKWTTCPALTDRKYSAAYNWENSLAIEVLL